MRFPGVYPGLPHFAPSGRSGTAQDIRNVWLNIKLDVNCVYPDDFLAGYSLVQELLKLGHQRIAYLHFPISSDKNNQHYSVRDRLGGASLAMSKADLSLEIHDGFVPEQEQPNILNSLLCCPSRPTAIIAYNEMVAMSVILQATANGLKIPEDVSIMTFPLQYYRVGQYIFSGAEVPMYDVGYHAVERLLAFIDGKMDDSREQAVEFRLVKGNTVTDPGR